MSKAEKMIGESLYTL